MKSSETERGEVVVALLPAVFAGALSVDVTGGTVDIPRPRNRRAAALAILTDQSRRRGGGGGSK
jgi:hypothetical protein